jgi:hypothetical protein
MAGGGQSIERLREYLRSLKPEARAMLVQELERALLRGDDDGGNELVLQELRHMIRVNACRHYANELAINETAARTHSELTLYLEMGTRVLLDSLRHAGDADRPFRQSQVDAAIRFCGTEFGAEYAGLLAKASEVAAHSAAAERTSIRA